MLESNLSKPALPVALGAGCEHRSTSSLDVCHQVMCPSPLFFSVYSFFFKTLDTHLDLVLPSLGHFSSLIDENSFFGKKHFWQFFLAESV